MSYSHIEIFHQIIFDVGNHDEKYVIDTNNVGFLKEQILIN